MARDIYQRIAAVMRKVHGVAKESKNQHGGYKYAGHEAVTAAIRQALIDEGIVQTVSTGDLQLHPGGHVTLACKIRWSCVYTPEELAGPGSGPLGGTAGWGDHIESTIYALQHAQTKNGSPTAQQIGQALSYACKNFAFKTLMLTGDPDADSDAGPLEPEKTADPALAARADKLLADYADALTSATIEQVDQAVQTWGRAGEVPGLRDKLVRARAEAKKRARGGAQ